MTAKKDREACQSILTEMKKFRTEPVLRGILVHSKRLVQFDIYAI